LIDVLILIIAILKFWMTWFSSPRSGIRKRAEVDPFNLAFNLAGYPQFFDKLTRH